MDMSQRASEWVEALCGYSAGSYFARYKICILARFISDRHIVSMHTYSNSSPQKKSATEQQARTQSEPGTQAAYASVNGNAAILQQLADNSDQVKKGAQLKAIADGRVFPVQRQPVASGRVVQLMPFNMLKLGRWYKVLVGQGVRILLLKTVKRSYDDRFVGAVFSDSEISGFAITIVNEGDILGLSDPPFEVDYMEHDQNFIKDNVIPEGAEHMEEDQDFIKDGVIPGGSEYMEEDQEFMTNDIIAEVSDPQGTVLSAPAPKASQLGVVSWNVNHFSDKDFGTLLAALRAQFNKFSLNDWKNSFETVDTLMDYIGKEKYVARYEKNPENFAKKHENTRAFKEKFRNIQNRTIKIARISKLTDEYLNMEFKPLAFSDKLQELIDIDWEGKYQSALKSTTERPAFTVLVKRLVDFAEDLRGVGEVKRIIQELKNNHRGILGKFDDVKIEDVDTMFGALTDINNSLMNLSDLKNMLSALHTNNIQRHIDEMFQRNSDWLDVVALHEVNDPEKLKGSDEYDMHIGPHLMSGQGTGQNEYYPLLVRKGANITVKQIYLVTTDGTMKSTDNGALEQWNKNYKKQQDKVFRPIVVYEIEKAVSEDEKQCYWLGIVHTTPESDSGVAEHNREKIYNEIAEGLKTLQEEADKRKMPLIIGGDYYLTAEAVTRNMESKDWREHCKDKDEMDDYVKVKRVIEQLERELNKKLDLLQQSWKKSNEDEESSDDVDIEYLNERLKFLAEAKRDSQILRNIHKLTVAARIEDLGLYLAQPVTGTNPKKKPLSRWFDLQIADFFIHGKAIKGAQVGILRPQGKIAKVDTDDMYNSKYWQHFSDHFPVGGVFSTENEDLTAHHAFVGIDTPKAMELAEVSNLRRFARLRLLEKTDVTQGKPDLTLKGLAQDQIKGLALDYLHDYLNKKYAVSKKFSTIEGCIAEIQNQEHDGNIPESKRLFVTSARDFEPDVSGTTTVPLPTTGKSRTPSPGKNEKDKSQRFLLNQQQELQQGWNCGDLAIGLSRDELVQWLLQHEDDEVIRELLAPEIRTAAATSLMNEEEEVNKSKRKKEKQIMQEEKLKTLFKLFDEAQEDDIREEAYIHIHSALEEQIGSDSAANRTGLPEGMLTEELKNLLYGYYEAHDAMKDVVLKVNEVLQITEMRDAMQLDAIINNDFDNIIPILDGNGVYKEFDSQLKKLKDADQLLKEYLSRKDVFRKYVQNYYGDHGWMVYHLDFKGKGGDIHTSVIDLAAMFKQTMVKIWVRQEGVFKLNGSTAQYGAGVVNILYNGYNHFIGLDDNPDFVAETGEETVPGSQDLMVEERK